MKAAITCKNLESSNFIYDLLTTPFSGCESLKGVKKCIDDHIMTDDVMEFELTEKEINALSKYSEVISIDINDRVIEPHYNKIGQTGIPKIASYNKTFSSEENVKLQITHSLLHCQTSNLLYADNEKSIGQPYSLSSINCSNVDVIVLDSGIDKTHPEFFDQNGEQQVIEFDWTLLKEADPISGTSIVNYQSSDYYSDTNGHGTSCASLVAGKKNGFAKNAKLYSLRSNELGNTTNGFYIEQCLKLALAFQKAKKLNLYGLQSSRPTILTNSWGLVGPRIADDLESNDINTSNFHTCFGGGKNTLSYNTLPGNNTVVDAYIRQLLIEGVHVLVSAGNINAYLVNTSNNFVDLHCFRRTESSSTIDYVTIKTESNKNKYTLHSTYGYNYKYGSSAGLATNRRHYCYQSPNIGLDQNKEMFPIIVVGDVIPIKLEDTDSNIYWSSGTAKSSYELLSLNSSESRIINDDSTCYDSKTGPFFVKSAYSSFGPDVDIYAPGNGAWTALSNQVTSTSSPLISAAINERYYFFNGTSSACPIVAGALATILAEQTNLSPIDAKRVLTSIGLKGGVMKTESSTITLSSYGTSAYTLDCFIGANESAMSTNSNYRIQNGGPSYFRTGNIEDLLFCCRFFDSNNILCQAYPLREAIVENNSESINIGLTILNKQEQTSFKSTHSLE